MIKKGIIIGLAIIAAAAAGICLPKRPEKLGNMGSRYSEQTTAVSDISFSGEAGERIKFSFRSDIVSGDLDIILFNSAGSEVYALDRAKELETFFTVDSSDTYVLAAECRDLIGDYEISVYRAD